MRKFALIKQEYPFSTHPWRITETIATSDGPRTRICDGVWAAQEEAMEILQKYAEEGSR